MGATFFILGRGRSGTTLLSRMLIAHPRVVVAPEGFFAMSLERRYGSGHWHAERVDAFCRDVVTEGRMRRWGLDLAWLRGALRARVTATGGALKYAEVCALVYRAYAVRIGRESASHLGDKNPHYALFADRIATTFPRARFVHLTRDPRDNVCSFRAVGFDLDDVDALAYRWRHYNEAIASTAARHPERFLRLRYEDLIAAPQRELTRLSRFLGLEYDPRMLRFQDADPREFYGSRSRFVPRLRDPLDATPAGRWRDELTTREAERIAAVCGPLARTLGYDLHARRTHAWAKHPKATLGHLVGWGSVVAERRLFDTLSAPVRSRLLNGYRRSAGRV